MSGASLNPTISALRLLRWDLCLVTQVAEDALAGVSPNLSLLEASHRRLSRGNVYRHPDLDERALGAIASFGAHVALLRTTLTALPRESWSSPDAVDALRHVLAYFEAFDADVSSWSFDALRGQKPTFDAPSSRARAFVSSNQEQGRIH